MKVINKQTLQIADVENISFLKKSEWAVLDVEITDTTGIETLIFSDTKYDFTPVGMQSPTIQYDICTDFEPKTPEQLDQIEEARKERVRNVLKAQRNQLLIESDWVFERYQKKEFLNKETKITKDQLTAVLEYQEELRDITEDATFINDPDNFVMPEPSTDVHTIIYGY